MSTFARIHGNGRLPLNDIVYWYIKIDEVDGQQIAVDGSDAYDTKRPPT
ncbi:MAG TPA: hypothetical protein VE130_10490 [Nitrososphaeraceae archaeon]|nr:hypothetical protein [Nitrososphaeraceae archaeon]